MKKFFVTLLLISFINMQSVIFAETVIKQDENGVYYVEEVDDNPADMSAKTYQQEVVQYGNQMKSQQELEDEADFQRFQVLQEEQKKEEKISTWKKVGAGILAAGAIVGIVFLSINHNKDKDKK